MPPFILTGGNIDPRLTSFRILMVGGGGGGPVPERDQKALFSSGQYGVYSAAGSSSAVDDWGLLNQMTETDSSSAAITSSAGVSLQQNTAASTNSEAFIVAGNRLLALDTLPLVNIKFEPRNTSNIRFFCGLQADNVSKLGSDDLSEAGIGIQFSTARGDSNFQFLSHQFPSGQDLVDSGIAFSVDPFYLQIDVTSPTSVTLRILDEDYVELATHTFTGAELFDATFTLSVFCGLRTLTGSVRTVRNYFTVAILRV